MVGGKTAVSRYTDGLPLPRAAAGGACSSTTGPIGFGFNTTSTCHVTLAAPGNTRAGLAAFCA